MVILLLYTMHIYYKSKILIYIKEQGKEIQNCLYDITKQKTVPNTFIKGKHIGGNDKLQSLHKKGELLPLIQNIINNSQSKL